MTISKGDLTCIDCREKRKDHVSGCCFWEPGSPAPVLAEPVSCNDALRIIKELEGLFSNSAGLGHKELERRVGWVSEYKDWLAEHVIHDAMDNQGVRRWCAKCSLPIRWF